ncbi:hypothetical protein VTK56DRAFT_1612 [Thermocarpiscus australiensis]
MTGINGIKSATGYIYWVRHTLSTLSQIPVDGAAVPTGPAEVLALDQSIDDFAIAVKSCGQGKAYIAGMYDNAVVKVDFGSARSSGPGERRIVAEDLTGTGAGLCTAVVFGRRAEDAGLFHCSWKAKDLAAATQRVFQRIPGTWHPSMDGKLYRQEGYDVLASGLSKSGWKQIVANDAQDQKNRTFAHPHFMFAAGERDGPLATYLVTAAARDNFDHVDQHGRQEGSSDRRSCHWCRAGMLDEWRVCGDCQRERYGRRHLLRRCFRLGQASVAEPKDQLEVVAGSKDGSTFVSKNNWIKLPVGYNLMDHLNTDLIITHPNVVFYDFYEAWTTPNPTDKDLYPKSRSGILAQAAPNVEPMIWDQVKGSDGVVRQFQWTARVEGDSRVTNSTHAMTLSQYLGRGVVSRGRMTLTSGLATSVAEHPHLHNSVDKEAVIQGIKNVICSPQHASLPLEPPLEPLDGHGTAKLGTDDGRDGGTAVVDGDTKVYGTDNLFVVDVPIFPGMPTGNPSAVIVIAAERAAQRILALRK